MLIDEEPFGTSLFMSLSEVTVLILHVIMMKPEIKLIIDQQPDYTGANVF